MAGRTNCADTCNRLDGTALRLSRLQLVFGPRDTMAPLLRALAEAIEPLALIPLEIQFAVGPEGCRLRVTCELDPTRADLAYVLAHLLRRHDTAHRTERVHSA